MSGNALAGILPVLAWSIMLADDRSGRRVRRRTPGLDDHDRRALRGPLLGELVGEVLRLVVVGDEAVALVALVGLVHRLPVRVAEGVTVET